MQYKISWLENTTSLVGKDYPHAYFTGFQGGGREYSCWDFFESTPEKLIHDVRSYLARSEFDIEVFSVCKKYEKKNKVIITEENL